MKVELEVILITQEKAEIELGADDNGLKQDVFLPIT